MADADSTLTCNPYTLFSSTILHFPAFLVDRNEPSSPAGPVTAHQTRTLGV
jgi:hypothetical protein